MFNCGICRTRTGQGMALVDAATSETLKGPSHSAHRELVDAVNDGNEEVVRDVCRHLRTKLDHQYPHVQLLALQALDACFKGCGRAFHDMMAAKDVLDTVVRLAVSETLEVDDEVRDKARRLLQAWAHATRLGAFQEALAELATVDGIPGHGAHSSRDPRVYGLDPAMKQQVAAAAGAWQSGTNGRRRQNDSDEDEDGGGGVFRDDLLRTKNSTSSRPRSGPLPPPQSAPSTTRAGAAPPPASNGPMPRAPMGNGIGHSNSTGSRAAQQVVHTVALPHSRPRGQAAPAGPPPPAAAMGALSLEPESPPGDVARRGGRGRGPPSVGSREGSVSPPHIGTGLVRSTSSGRVAHVLDMDSPASTPPGSPHANHTSMLAPPPPAAAQQQQQPQLPFQAPADPEEAALLTQMLASNLKDEAEALYEAGHLEAAEKVFSQALVYAPQERSLLCGRCQCSAARGAHAHALADARTVTSMAPGWHVGHALLGAALAATGARDEAMAAYDTAARLAADSRSEEASMEDAREYMQALDGLRTGTPH